MAIFHEVTGERLDDNHGHPLRPELAAALREHRVNAKMPPEAPPVEATTAKPRAPKAVPPAASEGAGEHEGKPDDAGSVSEGEGGNAPPASEPPAPSSAPAEQPSGAKAPEQPAAATKKKSAARKKK